MTIGAVSHDFGTALLIDYCCSNNTRDTTMKRFLVIFQRHIDAGIQKREFINIFAKDMDQAIAKWNAMRTPNEWLTSITFNPTKEEAWAHLP